MQCLFLFVCEVKLTNCHAFTLSLEEEWLSLFLSLSHTHARAHTHCIQCYIQQIQDYWHCCWSLLSGCWSVSFSNTVCINMWQLTACLLVTPGISVRCRISKKNNNLFAHQCKSKEMQLSLCPCDIILWIYLILWIQNWLNWTIVSFPDIFVNWN